MKHCKGCSHPTICNTMGCAAEEHRANKAKAAEPSYAELKAQRDELLEALKVINVQCASIAASDWRNWEELASIEEFERWAKSRASHIAVQARAAIAKAEGKEGGAA